MGRRIGGRYKGQFPIGRTRDEYIEGAAGRVGGGFRRAG